MGHNLLRSSSLQCAENSRSSSQRLYHLQTNGQVERYNRSIVNALRCYVSEHQNDWDEFTSAITFSYNCKLHSSIGLAPFELALSRLPPPFLWKFRKHSPRVNPGMHASTFSTVLRSFSPCLSGVSPRPRPDTNPPLTAPCRRRT
jgi:hypothetical protein